uniref:Uncharacterized protein n=1 Tax=Oryza sativa subsp. japonica TaxID=39947 RepID=Q7XHQ2_ORYSJ|nr:hypothetical protein [Oryza sativa Japonica Group]
MDSSPVCEENRAPVGFSGNRAAAEVAHAAAMLMAAAALAAAAHDRRWRHAAALVASGA